MTDPVVLNDPDHGVSYERRVGGSDWVGSFTPFAQVPTAYRAIFLTASQAVGIFPHSAYVALLDNHIASCFRSTVRASDAPLFGRLHPHTMQPLPGPLVLFPNHSLRVAIQAQLHNATDTQGAAAPANETRTPPGPPSQ